MAGKQSFDRRRLPMGRAVWLAMLCTVAGCSCCSALRNCGKGPPKSQQPSMYMCCRPTDARSPLVPRELNRVSLPTYQIAPPDILLIDAVSTMRPAGAPLQAGDQIAVRLQNGLPISAGGDAATDSLEYEVKRQTELMYKVLNGVFPIAADGAIDLGPAYGKVIVGGLTLDGATAAIKRHLEQNVGLREPKLSVLLAESTGRQAISGEHLVRPDGTVSLGIYGEVHVAGRFLPEAKALIEEHLSAYLQNPHVNVDVLAYNSKVFYIIMDGGGFGEQIVRLPCTGNETVLDAISQVDGLSQVSSKDIWIARPSHRCNEQSMILKVDWNAITACGVPATNYQVLPGDRIYVQADKLVATDNFLAKLTAPIERVLGVVLLGTSTAKNIKFFNQFNGSNNSGTGTGF